MPNDTPLADPRLEAAAQIRKSVIGGNLIADGAIKDARRSMTEQPKRAAAILSTATRETKAQELAQALEHITDLFISLKPLGEDTEKEMAVIASLAALASFKEIANG
jgi:hypothetical protein